MAVSASSPMLSRAASVPQYASPAPVVSTAVTGTEGTWTSPHREPRVPRVCSTDGACDAGPLEQLGLVLVDHDRVAQGEDGLRQRGERGEVEDDASPPGGAELDGGGHDVERELERHEQDVARAEVVELGEVRMAHVVVGAGRDDDHVLALAVVVDDGGSGRGTGHALHPRRVHAEGRQALEVLVPLRVVAHLADEERLRTCPHRGDRLVGALAPEAVLDVPGHHRLAGAGVPLHVQVQVLTQGAEDDHSAHGVLSSRGGGRRRDPGS